MTDSGSSRHQEHSNTIRTRSRSASEAIRRRVNQLLISTGTKFEPVETSYSKQFRSGCNVRASSMSAPPIRRSHSPKRRKCSKVENRNVDSSCDALPHSAQKGRSFVSNRPRRHSQLLEDHSDDESLLNESTSLAERARLRKEIESLKEALQESKKANKRQSKKYEETRAELNVAVQTLQDKESELTSLKTKCARKEELLSTIEVSLQCQICMDIPERPFALSPCGHVLCLTCLQEWFRKAPPTLDDVDIDPEELTDSRYVLMRSKSCPSCRAIVKHRPVPIFMIKAITAALRKAKTSGLPNERDLSKGDDPWRGIFPSSEDDGEDGDDEDGDSSTDDSDSEFDIQLGLRTAPYYLRRRAVRRAMFHAMYSSALSEAEEPDDDDDDDDEDEAEVPSESDEGQDNIRYVRPRWAPPTVFIDPTEVDLSGEEDPSVTFKLLQRGCTWDMIQSYDLSYDHASGIVLSLRSLNRLYASDDDGEDGDVEAEGMNRIFLGWNIALDQVDVDGEIFICTILEDIKHSPLKWELTPRTGVPGAMDARRLVPSDGVMEYDTTDTEMWVSDDF